MKIITKILFLALFFLPPYVKSGAATECTVDDISVQEDFDVENVCIAIIFYL